ncbi:MAG: hypothetical protein ABIE07_03075 [Candidatus Zixiibacteriota bacterium]
MTIKIIFYHREEAGGRRGDLCFKARDCRALPIKSIGIARNDWEWLIEMMKTESTQSRQSHLSCVGPGTDGTNKILLKSYADRHLHTPKPEILDLNIISA